MDYVDWPLEEGVIIKNKKKTFVKCFCSKCGKQTADRSVLQMEKSDIILCRSCSLKEKSARALEKRKQTCLKKYGVENPFQNEDIKQKIESKLDRKEIGRKISDKAKNRTSEEIKAINNKRKETISKIDKFYEKRQEKTKATCLKKYGVKSTLQTKAAKDGLKKKYNVENISQSSYWKETVRNNSLKKFGTEWPTQNKEIIDKIQKTNIEKYGFKYYINNPDFRKTLYKKWTSEALQRYNLDLIGCEIVDNNIIKCKKCGFQKEINNAQKECNLKFCPNCHNNLKSRYEFLISEYLKKININFITNDRSIIKPKELDIYVPSKKVAIEVDGLYFHQNKPKNYHLEKTENCIKNGIKLLHITDKMLLEHNDIVFSIIDSFLGISNRVFARKCFVKIIDNKTYKDFCNENHLQGYCAATIKLGLFYKDELLQVESFSKPRFNKNYEWELVRECSKVGYNIIGGKSKIFSYFLKNYSPKSVISYCDRSMFTGSSYEKALNMKLIKQTPPSYVYYKDGQTLTRYQCQKHKLKNFTNFKFDESLSEQENMKNNGYGNVYDCGENVYLWQLK